MTDMFFNFLGNAYPWIKSLHIMSVMAWMAGLFYLPRLFVYHVEGHEKKGVVPGSEMDLLFQRQERLLLKAIMEPARGAAWLFGILLALTPGVIDWSMVWPWTKLLGIVAMSGFHDFLGATRKRFAAGENKLTGRTYRLLNEVPTVLMILIVLSVVVKF